MKTFQPQILPGVDAPIPPSDATTPDRERRIAEAAYYRYERRNGGDGDPIQDWLEAEAEVDGKKN